MYLSNLKLWNFRKFGSGADSLDVANYIMKHGPAPNKFKLIS